MGAILLVGILLTLVGGLATGGKAAIEVRFLAGWGAACALLTLWGITLPGSLAWPAGLLLAAGLSALVWRRSRPGIASLAEAGRILVLSLPLFALMASVRLALPDTFLNLLPNAAYLVDFGRFPASDAARTISIFPALPYNTQFAAYLASLLTGSLVENGLVFFNILVQLAGGLFFGRLVATALAPDGGMAVRVGWRDAAIGLALVAAVNPGFLPKLAFSSMGEPSTEITLAVAAALILAALPLPGRARPGLSTAALGQAALVLLAFVNVRQSNIGLLAALVLALGLLLSAEPLLRRWRIAAGLALSLAPAFLLYFAWRFYVLDHFATGELKVLPFAEWQFSSLPRIFGAMLQAALRRPFLYLCLIAAFAALAAGWRRRPWSPAQRALLLLLGLTAGYNGFLLFTYVAHFANAEDPAHSYYRYTSHLGQVLVLALTLWTAERVRGFGFGRADRLHRGAGRLAIGLAAILPLLFVTKLRFDLQQPQPIVWDMMQRFTPELRPAKRLALALPGDNGTVSLQIRGHLALTPPRRPEIDTKTVERADPETLAALGEAGYDTLLLSCADGTALAAAAPSAVLARFAAGRWQAVDRFDFPQRRSGKWDPILAAAPLCGAPPRVARSSEPTHAG